MDELKCPICGEPTFVYYGNARKDRLCKKHASDLRAGLIAQCEKCGEWREADKPCPKCNPAKEAPTKVEQAKDAPKITCLLCGADSNGYHFCTNCYAKHKDKSIDIRITITNRIDVEILDKYGNRSIKCLDGTWVRSRNEARIRDWLYHNKIRSIYEKDFWYYEEDGSPIHLRPDFTLEDNQICIEYNELKTKEYLKNKEKTKHMYESMGYKVVIITEKDAQDLDSFLKPILRIN